MIGTVRVPLYRDCAGPCVIGAWNVCEGDEVEAGEVVCQVEVDKVTLDLEAPQAGVVRAVLAEAGYAVAPGATVAVIADAEEPIPPDLLRRPDIAPPPEPRPIPSLLAAEPHCCQEPGELEALDAMRRTIARRMTYSKLSAPHFYLTTSVDMTACQELRQKLKAERIRATFNDMLIKAAALALRKYPRVASRYVEGGYESPDGLHVGFAAAVEPEGLVVPVIRQADCKPLAEIALETKALIQKTRDRHLTPDDYAGGVFTVSNLGSFDVDKFTAIVNPGESAILAVGKIQDTPVVEKGEIVVRPIMKMTLSSDHRVIDGALAARFNGYLKTLLQAPEQLVPAGAFTAADAV